MPKSFPVEHFGVDLRGESGSPRAPSGPFLSSGAAVRRGDAPRRAPPESWPSVGGLASGVHAHRLALAQASGQELRARGSAKRHSRRLEAEWLGRFDR